MAREVENRILHSSEIEDSFQGFMGESSLTDPHWRTAGYAPPSSGAL